MFEYVITFFPYIAIIILKVDGLTGVIILQNVEQIRWIGPAYDPDANAEVLHVCGQRRLEEQPQRTARVAPCDAALAAPQVHRRHATLGARRQPATTIKLTLSNHSLI